MKTTLSPAPRQQRGVTLVVVLVMLMIVTLLGLASIRGSTTQERMVTGFYDRSLSMQSAEAALRTAYDLILEEIESPGSTGIKIDDCENKDCPAIPDSTFKGGGNEWNTVDASSRPNSSLAAGEPQFYVQKLGEKVILNEETSTYETIEDKSTAYRFVARSGDPADKKVDGRSLVVLAGATRFIEKFIRAPVPTP